MSEYIERKAAIENVLDQMTHSKNPVCMYERLMNMESADVVSRAAYDQTDWERCIALTQLKEIGKGLGERMDDVRPVVRGKWIEDWETGCSECPACHDTFLWEDFKGVADWHFCPNCGARMEES